jgi:hypothetical protein
MEAAALETKPLGMNKQKLHTLAGDLRKTTPRSPRQKVGGFVIAARMVDKAHADLLRINGEYNFYPCAWRLLLEIHRLDAAKFKEFVATGASDEEIDGWVPDNATQKDPKAIIKCNNEMIGLRLCDLPEGVQEYFETYIPQFCNPESKVKFFFDVYDVEEGVL